MMYRIEFDGRLLDGFDLQMVRMEVGVRLRLRDEQIDRLFSGQTVVLKKAINEKSSQAYLNELRALGLDAKLVPMEGLPEVRDEGAQYKVVFWGRILPGFERETVMAAVAKRLKLSPTVLKQVFSGAKVVLKRGVSADKGGRLVVDLALLGMQIELEVDAPAAAVAEPKPAPEVPEVPSAAQQEDDPQYGALLRTACDLSGTPFAGYDTSSSIAPSGEGHAAVPDIPPPAPVPKVGFAPANTDGYLNCPMCGLYQPYGVSCKKCGAALPQKRTGYVGRQEYPSGTPTTVVNRGDELTVVVPDNPRPAQVPLRRRHEHTLHTQMMDQYETEPEVRRSRLPYLIIVLILGILAALAVYLLRR